MNNTRYSCLAGRLRGLSLVVIALMLGSGFMTTFSAEPEKASAGMGQMNMGQSASTEEVTELVIPDISVTDQDGNLASFYSDLVAGRTVAINTIYTTCTTVCPMMGVTFTHLQEKINERFPGEVSLISISLDPVTDTPARLKSWSENFRRGEDWTLVTGEKAEIDKLLKALNLFIPDREDHPPIVLIGNDAAGHWTRTYGVAPASTMADMLGDALAAPHGSSAAGSEGGHR